MDAGEAAVDAHDMHTVAQAAQVQLGSAVVATSPAESVRVRPRAVLDDIYNAVCRGPLPASCNLASAL